MPYIIDANNVDNYPLMGRFFFGFNTSLGYSVGAVSNSTIDWFEYSEINRTIEMLVSNTTPSQDYGFCRTIIPNVLIDTEKVEFWLMMG